MTSVDNSPVEFIPSIHYTIINNPKDHSVHLSERSDWDDLEHLVSRNSTIYTTSHKTSPNNHTIFTNNSSFVNQNVLCYESNQKIDKQVDIVFNSSNDRNNLSSKTVVNINMGYNCGSSLESVVHNQSVKDKNINFVSDQNTTETNKVNETNKTSTMNSNSTVNANDINQKKSFKHGGKSGHSRQWGSCGSAVTLRLMNFESNNLDNNTDLSIFTENAAVVAASNKGKESNWDNPTNYPYFGLSNDQVTPTDEKNNRSYFKNYPNNFKRISQASFEAEFDADGRIHEQMALDLRKIDPQIIAGQITLIEHALYTSLKREEFLSFKWNGPSKQLHAPGIVACTKWFNQLHFWAQRMILETKDLHKRAEMLGYFIRVIKKLVDNFNNLSSGMALVRALDCQCIHRLRQTWVCLSSREKTIYKRMEELFSNENNCENLRQATHSLKPPCVPHIGMWLTDLTYIKAHSKLTDAESHADADRINSILSQITAYQTSKYDEIIPNMMLIRYLESQRYIEELQNVIEDYNHRLSNALEPPEKQKSSTNVIPNQSSPATAMSPQQQHQSALPSSQQKALVPYPSSSVNNSLTCTANSVNTSACGIANFPNDISNQNQACYPLDGCPAYRCAVEQQTVFVSSSGVSIPANLAQPATSTCPHQSQIAPHNLQLPLTPLPLQLLPHNPTSASNEESLNPDHHVTMDTTRIPSMSSVSNRKIEITNTTNTVSIEKYPSSDSVHPSMLCGGRNKKAHNTSAGSMETKTNKSSGNHTNPIARSLRFRRKSGTTSSSSSNNHHHHNNHGGKQRHRGNNPVAPLGTTEASPITAVVGASTAAMGHSSASQKANSDIGIGSRMHSMSLLDDSYLDDTSTVSQQPCTAFHLTNHQHQHEVASNIASSSSSIVTKGTLKDKSISTVAMAPNSSVVMQQQCYGEFLIDNSRHPYELIMEGGTSGGSTNNTRGISSGPGFSRSSTLVRSKKKGATAANLSSLPSVSGAGTEVCSTPPIIKCKMKKNQFSLKPKVTTCTTSFLNLVNVANAARVATSSITPSSPQHQQPQQVYCDSYNPLYSSTSSSNKHEINSTTVLEDEENEDTINEEDNEILDDEVEEMALSTKLLSGSHTTPDKISILAQGLLSRKTCRRHHSSPFLSLWQRYWITLLQTEDHPKSAFLVYFALSSKNKNNSGSNSSAHNSSSHNNAASSSVLSSLSSHSVSRHTLACLVKSTKCHVQDLQQVVIGRQFSHNSVVKLNRTAPPRYRPPASTSVTMASSGAASSPKEHFYLQDCEYSVVYKFKSPLSPKKKSTAIIHSSSSSPTTTSSSSATTADQTVIHTNPSVNMWISLLIRTLNSVQQTPKSAELDLINLNDS